MHVRVIIMHVMRVMISIMIVYQARTNQP